MPKPTVIQKKSLKDWYRVKCYPHIGLLLSPEDRAFVASYVADKAKVATHAFSPFIHRSLTVRKFRREICHDGTRSKLRKPGEKVREIFYANHIDSNIYSYYSHLLQKEYERVLSRKKLKECITAYRRIKVDPVSLRSRNKCNIDFANDVFSYIKTSSEDLVTIAFDVKSFFDNLDHKYLKKCWREVMGTGLDLPKDHYNVFKSITKFSYVRENAIFNLFQDKIHVKRSTGLTQKKIVRKKYMRNKRAIALCLKEDIPYVRNSGIIKANKYFSSGTSLKLRTRGIPQGSPISATLANIYMLTFDQNVNEMVAKIGGIYRRYSDDMVVVCSPDDEKFVIDFVMNEISDCRLEIQSSKTQVFHFIFDKDAGRHYCYEKNLNTQRLSANRNFEYLGFQFDGFHSLLKNSSLASYYRKMKKTIRRGKFHSKHNRTTTKGELFVGRLYKRFTHLGASRRRLFMRDPKNPSHFLLTPKIDWGNYITYAKLASNILPDNKIKSQIKRHWKIFHEEIAR